MTKNFRNYHVKLQYGGYKIERNVIASRISAAIASVQIEARVLHKISRTWLEHPTKIYVKVGN